MHGQFPYRLVVKLLDNEQSCHCLQFGNIKAETESTVVAAQYQEISTNYFNIQILKEEIESKCRLRTQ
jgi:hypothetical protein